MKPFFDKDVSDILWRFSGSDRGSGGRVVSAAVALEAARMARGVPGGAPPQRRVLGRYSTSPYMCPVD